MQTSCGEELMKMTLHQQSSTTNVDRRGGQQLNVTKYLDKAETMTMFFNCLRVITTDEVTMEGGGGGATDLREVSDRPNKHDHHYHQRRRIPLQLGQHVSSSLPYHTTAQSTSIVIIAVSLYS